MCEEFHCLPTQAMEAMDDDVGGLLFRIIDLRTYAKAKQIYDSTPMEKRKTTPLMDVVSDITFELAKERINQRTK